MLQTTAQPKVYNVLHNNYSDYKIEFNLIFFTNERKTCLLIYTGFKRALSGHPQQEDFPASQASNFSVSFVWWGRIQASSLPTKFN